MMFPKGSDSVSMKGLLRIQVLNFAKTKVAFVPLKNARWMSKRVPHAESKLH